MKTSIELNRIRFFSYHGVAEQERRVGNDYEVSLRVDYPLERAMESDSLCDTLDYAALYVDVCRAYVHLHMSARRFIKSE